MRFHEHFKRSIVKAISYRCVIVASDFIVLYFVTHRWDITLGVIGISNLSSTFLYIAHERVWNKIHWGKEHRKK